MRLRFDDCIFDSETRELFREGRPVALPPREFQLLETLIRVRPKAVAKAELHETLWPATFVSDANLANVVAALRAALGDDARNPRIIRTVQRFGYAFRAEAEAVEAAASVAPSFFKLIWGDREVALRTGENIIGRDPDAAAWLDVHSISRRHARVTISGDRAVIEDLGSKNGTLVNGKTVAAATPLSVGDRVRIGTVEMTFSRFVAVSTETARSR